MLLLARSRYTVHIMLLLKDELERVLVLPKCTCTWWGSFASDGSWPWPISYRCSQCSLGFQCQREQVPLTTAPSHVPAAAGSQRHAAGAKWQIT